MVIRTVVVLHSSSCSLLKIGTEQQKRMMSVLAYPTSFQRYPEVFQHTVLFPNVSLEFNTTNQDYFTPYHFILYYCQTCLLVSHNKCCLASPSACGSHLARVCCANLVLLSKISQCFYAWASMRVLLDIVRHWWKHLVVILSSNGKQCDFCNTVTVPRENFLTFLLLVSIKWIDTYIWGIYGIVLG